MRQRVPGCRPGVRVEASVPPQTVDDVLVVAERGTRVAGRFVPAPVRKHLLERKRGPNDYD